MVISLLTLASGLVALLTWLLRRKATPTLEERVDDIQTELVDELQEMQQLRRAGDHAGAEFIRRRLLEREINRTSNHGEPERK